MKRPGFSLLSLVACAGAALALAEIGGSAVSTIVLALEDDRAYVRESAAQELRQIGPQAAEAVPALIQALGDQNSAVRRMSAQALGKIGPLGAEAVPALIQVLRRDADYVARAAGSALQDITGQDLGVDGGMGLG